MVSKRYSCEREGHGGLVVAQQLVLLDGMYRVQDYVHGEEEPQIIVSVSEVCLSNFIGNRITLSSQWVLTFRSES